MISQFLPLVEDQILRKLIPRSDESYSDILVLMDMSSTSVTIMVIKIHYICGKGRRLENSVYYCYEFICFNR